MKCVVALFFVALVVGLSALPNKRSGSDERAQKLAEKLAREEKMGIAKRSGGDHRKICNSLVGTWPEGVIPWGFCDAPNVIEKKDLKREAIAKLAETLGSFLEFKEITLDGSCTNAEYQNYIIVKSDKAGCWSYIGMNGGVQTLNLQQNSCNSIKVIGHEFLHAAGLYHEQQYSISDAEVKTENIKDGMLSQFSKNVKLCIACEYMTCSQMHYHSKAFSKNGQETIVASKTAFMAGMGGDELAGADICNIASLYEIKGTCTGIPDGSGCKFGTGHHINSECNCLCGRYLEGDDCGKFKTPANYRELNAANPTTEISYPESSTAKYNYNEDQSWMVACPEGKKVVMELAEVSVEDLDRCAWDKLEILSGESVHDCAETYCDSSPSYDELKPPTTLTSKGNFVIIRLVSDEYENFKGFTFKFKYV